MKFQQHKEIPVLLPVPNTNQIAWQSPACCHPTLFIQRINEKTFYPRVLIFFLLLLLASDKEKQNKVYEFKTNSLVVLFVLFLFRCEHESFIVRAALSNTIRLNLYVLTLHMSVINLMCKIMSCIHTLCVCQGVVSARAHVPCNAMPCVISFLLNCFVCSVVGYSFSVRVC